MKSFSLVQDIDKLNQQFSTHDHIQFVVLATVNSLQNTPARLFYKLQILVMLVNSAVLLYNFISEHCRRGSELHHWHQTLDRTTLNRESGQFRP